MSSLIMAREGGSGPAAANELLGLAYEAATEPAGWRVFLEHLGKALRADVPGLFVHDRTTDTPGISVVLDADPTWTSAYDRHFIHCDLRRPRIQALRALRVQQELLLATARADASNAALDRFTTGVLLLDRRGRVVAANAKASRLLRGRDGLALVDGQLSAVRAAEVTRLRALVERAVGSRPCPVREAGTISVSRTGSARALSLLAAPLAPGPLARFHGGAVAIVFVFDPEERVCGPVEIVETVLGLTRAEARVVLELARGTSLRDVADTCGVSLHTVRTQLKQALAKTGARRQGELIRLVLASPAALRGEPPGQARTPSGG